jgi:putative membrane protein
MNPYYSTGPWFWFWPVGWLIFIFICIMCARILFGGRRYRRGWYGHSHDHHHDGSHNEDPLAAAKLRYAKGEITKDQFETIKKDLKD